MWNSYILNVRAKAKVFWLKYVPIKKPLFSWIRERWAICPLKNTFHNTMWSGCKLHTWVLGCTEEQRHNGSNFSERSKSIQYFFAKLSCMVHYDPIQRGELLLYCSNWEGPRKSTRPNFRISTFQKLVWPRCFLFPISQLVDQSKFAFDVSFPGKKFDLIMFRNGWDIWVFLSKKS